MGGMQDHTRSLARALVAAGHDVEVVTTRHPEAHLEEERDGSHMGTTSMRATTIRGCHGEIQSSFAAPMRPSRSFMPSAHSTSFTANPPVRSVSFGVAFTAASRWWRGFTATELRSLERL